MINPKGSRNQSNTFERFKKKAKTFFSFITWKVYWIMGLWDVNRVFFYECEGFYKSFIHSLGYLVSNHFSGRLLLHRLTLVNSSCGVFAKKRYCIQLILVYYILARFVIVKGILFYGIQFGKSSNRIFRIIEFPLIKFCMQTISMNMNYFDLRIFKILLIM